MPHVFRVRRGLEADLPNLAPGEPALTTDTNKFYVGTLTGNVLIASSGDMSKSVYDINNDGKVNSASSADSVPWSGITNKPTTYYTHPNHSGDATSTGDGEIILSASGVEAGTYKSVTVDTKGRVTAGTNPTTISGYGITDAATLVDGKIPSSQLPSYVDDVLEYDDYVSLPVTGTGGIIYITTDNNKQYRWSGSAYAEIVSSPGTTDAITEGSTNLWHTSARVLDTVLTGLSTATNAAIVATESILVSIGKLAARVNAIWDETDIDRIYIPVGATGVSYRVGRNCTFNYTYVDCLDLAGAADAPTSLTVSVAKGGTNQFTTGAITTAAATYDNTDFNADAGDLITVTVSNTTGVAGGVMIGLRWVRR